MKEYTKNQNKSNIELGDIVIVTREAIDFENNWSSCWISQMNKNLGKESKVVEIHPEKRI